MTKNKYPAWMGKPILSEDHGHDLDHRAAQLEFGEGQDRGAAETQAHREYLETHHREAAAHHHRGQRAAEAAGDTKEARKHGIAYSLHMQALGHEDIEEVPEEIKKLAEAPDKKTHYRFKSHRGDRLLLDSEGLD